MPIRPSGACRSLQKLLPVTYASTLFDVHSDDTFGRLFFVYLVKFFGFFLHIIYVWGHAVA
jgi:hypothetical protein